MCDKVILICGCFDLFPCWSFAPFKTSIKVWKNYGLLSVMTKVSVT